TNHEPRTTNHERGPLMKGILTKWLNNTNLGDRLHDEEEWSREVETLYVLLSNYHGTDKLVLKASKLEALKLMRSDELVERVAGLRKIVSDDPTVQKIPKMQDVPQLLDEIEEQIAELIARRSVEERLEVWREMLYLMPPPSFVN
ncbi:MAG TPA: hypothetical protein VMW91_07735, partial [Desulfosporosinus sp.]|nr:hypothetical protein [Desulfosporosinus sp.]